MLLLEHAQASARTEELAIYVSIVIKFITKHAGLFPVFLPYSIQICLKLTWVGSG